MCTSSLVVSLLECADFEAEVIEDTEKKQIFQQVFMTLPSTLTVDAAEDLRRN